MEHKPTALEHSMWRAEINLALSVAMGEPFFE
jgi:hypothetical protein